MSENDRMRQMRMTPLEAREQNGLKGFGFTVSWPDNGPAWSTDMETAPRGHTVPVERKTKDGVAIHHVHVVELLWAASRCGKVMVSWWILPTRDHPHGRWCMFRSDHGRKSGEIEHPVAWRPFVQGEFPMVMVDKKATWPKGKAPDFPTHLFEVAA